MPYCWSISHLIPIKSPWINFINIYFLGEIHFFKYGNMGVFHIPINIYILYIYTNMGFIDWLYIEINPPKTFHSPIATAATASARPRLAPLLRSWRMALWWPGVTAAMVATPDACSRSSSTWGRGGPGGPGSWRGRNDPPMVGFPWFSTSNWRSL